MCNPCTDYGLSELCPACLAIVGTFPLGATAGAGDVLGFAWRTMMAHAGVFFGAGFVSLLAMGLLNIAQRLVGGVLGADAVAASLVFTLVFFIVSQVLSAALTAGRLGVARRAAHGGVPDVDDFLRGAGRVLPVWGITLLSLLVMTLVGALAAIPAVLMFQRPGGLDFATPEALEQLLPAVAVFGGAYLVLLAPAMYVTIPLSLALVPAADGVGIAQALRLGFAAAEGHRFSVFGVQVVTGLAMIPAVMLCCIGMPFGLAFIDLGVTTAYLAYAPRGSASADGVAGT